MISWLNSRKGRSFTYSPRSIRLAHQAKKGGDLGEFRQGQMVPAFDKACFQGEVLTPQLVKTKFGWHVVKVLYRT